MVKNTGTSFKKDNITTSNSYSALNDEEEDDVENMYDELANTFTKTGGSLSFTAAAVYYAFVQNGDISCLRVNVISISLKSIIAIAINSNSMWFSWILLEMACYVLRECNISVEAKFSATKQALPNTIDVEVGKPKVAKEVRGRKPTNGNNFLLRWFKTFNVGIKSLLDVVGITAAYVCVNATQMELVLLVNFKENMLNMDQDSAHMVAASKVSMLKPGEYKIWRMRIEQYIQMIDYALWEVIENGVTFPKTQLVEGVTIEMPITTAEEKAQRSLEVKARKVAGSCRKKNWWECSYKKNLEEKLSQEDINEKLLRSLSPEWNTHVVVRRSKVDLDTMSIDDLYNNLKVYELEVKGMCSSSSSTQNMAFVSSSNNNTSSTNGTVNTAHGVSTASTQVNAAYSTNIDNLNDAVICSFFASQPNSPQLVHEDLEQIHPDDIEEMDIRWQIAMLTIRDRRSLDVETYASTALVSCDGLDGYDWSDHLDEFVNKPVVENYKAKSSEEEPRVVRKNDDALIIEEWVSDNKEEDVSQPKIKKKIVRPSIAKIEFVKSKQQEKTTGKLLNKMRIIGKKTHRSMIDYKEIDEGYVAFGGNPKGRKITRKDTLKLAEAVNTACYVQNILLVIKPHNKNSYELFYGRAPTLSFIRLFGCHVTILNAIDHLGKFNSKVDEGFFVGYSLNSKAFRVFNSRTRIVDENLYIRFSESTPNVVGSGPDWLFDIDTLTRTISYELYVAGTQSNGFAGTRASNNACQARKKTKSIKDYIFLPLWTADPPFSQDAKSSHDDGSKPSSDDEKKVDEDPRKENECNDQKRKIMLTALTMLILDDEDDGPVADMNNLDTTIRVSPIPTTRFHKDHPLDQVIGDLQLATQTRKMLKNLEEHRHKGDILRVQVYVDDIIFGLTKKELSNAFERLMHEKFQMSSVGQLTFFLELQVKQKKDGIYISQNKYVPKILIKFGFIEVKIASIPMEIQKPLLKDEDGEEVDVHMYRSMIGSLMYLTSLRPDIMFAVCACARYQVNPKVSHLHVMKRIFRYLKGQPKLSLWYLKDSPFDLVAYTNSNYDGASLDRKSTIGGCQFIECRLIS
nr:uncharacterized mitochondrial protein AtMg00810-like [Tanacetum cinerariifolium]